MSGDGRLDLDELGEVIDRASALDPAARAEVIDDGNGRTWAERLEDAGVTPWLRRHRRVLAGGAVAVVAVTAVVIGYPRLVPPPVDPEMRVTVAPVIPSQYVVGDAFQNFDQLGIFSTGASLRTAYALTKQAPDDTSSYRVDGIRGPMMRASSASPQTAMQRGIGPEAARADVDVVLDCFDATPLPITPGSYGLVVSRTDELGRTLTKVIPVDDLVVNWPSYVTAICGQFQAQFALSPTVVRTTVDRATRTVTADVTVSNAMRFRTVLSVDPFYGPAPILAAMDPVELSPLTAAALRVRLTVHDCTSPALQFLGQPSFPGDERSDGGAQGVYLGVDVASPEFGASGDPTGNGGRASAPLLFTPRQAQQIDGALESLCAGAPTAALVVDQVGRARKVKAAWSSGTEGAVRVPVTVTATVSEGRRVRLDGGPAGPDETVTTRLAPVTAAVVAGPVRMRTELDVDCSSGYVQPPMVQVETTTSRGTFPRYLSLNSPKLTAAIAAACPQIGVQQLVEFGWEDPRIPLLTS